MNDRTENHADVRAPDDFARLFRVPGIGQVLAFLDENDDDMPCVTIRIPDADIGRLQLSLSGGGMDYDRAEAVAREILEKMQPDNLAEAVKPLTDMKARLSSVMEGGAA